MDEDDQSLRDYENQIYGLNYDHEEGSAGDTVDEEHETPELSDEEDGSQSPVQETEEAEKALDLPLRLGKTSHARNPEKPVGEYKDDSDLSENERELILSQLYHGSSVPTTSAIPVNGTNSPTKSSRKRKLSKSEVTNGNIPSTPFTFNLDLDNLPPPPPSLPETTIEAATLDSDGDFTVYSYLNELTPGLNTQPLLRPPRITLPSAAIANNLFPL